MDIILNSLPITLLVYQDTVKANFIKYKHTPNSGHLNTGNVHDQGDIRRPKNAKKRLLDIINRYHNLKIIPKPITNKGFEQGKGKLQLPRTGRRDLSH
jgi:hypothetical protein